jgi:hypothetical protein
MRQFNTNGPAPVDNSIDECFSVLDFLPTFDRKTEEAKANSATALQKTEIAVVVSLQL